MGQKEIGGTGGWKIEHLFPMFARKKCQFDDSQHNLPRISV